MPQITQFTKYNIITTDAEGNTSSDQYISEAQLEKAQKDAEKNKLKVEVAKAQTFSLTQAESVDEILTCVPNAEVALDYFNNGYKLAQFNVARPLMTDPDWQGQEGVYDLNADVQQPKEKRVADPLSSSRRSLKALFSKLNPGAPEPTDDEINAVLAQFVGASQAA